MKKHGIVLLAMAAAALGLAAFAACKDDETPPMEHTHAYSSWIVVDEPTCTKEGLRERTCSCGEKETEAIAALGHSAGEAVRENEKAPTCTEKGSYEEVVYCTVCEEEHTCSRCQETETQTIDALDHAWSAYSFDETNHWRECTRAGCSAKEEAKHSFTRNTCETCGYAFYSEGLLYEVNNDTITITGLGTCSDTTIYIPAVIDEKPVTEIGNYAFLRCTSLTEIVIPEGVTSIGDSAFDGCDELTTVYYRGSKEQWDSIIGSNKDALTGVQIICDYTGE